MKNKKLLFLISLLSISLLAGCYSGDGYSEDSENETSNDSFNPSSSSSEVYYEVIDKGEYLEKEDSTEGLTEDDLKDFSLLINKINTIENNYTKETQVFFNKNAVNRVNKIYDTTFVQNQTSLYASNCVYRYDEEGYINEGYLSKKNEDKTYKVILDGDDVEHRLSSKVKEENLSLVSEEKGFDDYFFTINDIDQTYIDTYGPCTVKYTSSYSVDYEGWTRVGTNKFKCDREEVIKDVMSYVSPGFSNAGTYMTFRYVTVEVDVDENTPLRVRLYASPTQIGKLIDEHVDETKPNWYLLFAEAKITNINVTSIIPLENYIAS